jgi:hypothetical protein
MYNKMGRGNLPGGPVLACDLTLCLPLLKEREDPIRADLA